MKRQLFYSLLDLPMEAGSASINTGDASPNVARVACGGAP
jgi:hypothetical protein